MGEQDTLLNAVIGAVASAVLGFVPFSPVLGGAIAGYLQGGTRSDGLRVGAISGVLGLFVGAVFFGLFFVLFGAYLFGVGAPPLFSHFALFVLAIGAILSALYTVGLSALGGWLGNYARYEMDL
ncbi:DUF5518 domain-containing protein [Haloarcula laminariae]|uniref:DUF5518 domain-containing protein n=1 Tax=Haloarcula laminariae TaxID=2961577 RepID=UPI0021C63D03|nr:MULTISPECIES: DUF5518 domain-containing protein [Halomicroarcula]